MCDLARLVGLGNLAAEAVVGHGVFGRIVIDRLHAAVGSVIDKLRDVFERVGHRGLIAGSVVGESGCVAQRIGHRGAAAGIVVGVRGRILERVDGLDGLTRRIVRLGQRAKGRGHGQQGGHESLVNVEQHRVSTSRSVSIIPRQAREIIFKKV